MHSLHCSLFLILSLSRGTASSLYLRLLHCTLFFVNGTDVASSSHAAAAALVVAAAASSETCAAGNDGGENADACRGGEAKTEGDAAGAAPELVKLTLTFVNECDHEVDVWWDNDGWGVRVGRMSEKGGTMEMTTYTSHRFFFTLSGTWRRVGEDAVMALSHAEESRLVVVPAAAEAAAEDDPRCEEDDDNDLAESDSAECADKERGCKRMARNNGCATAPGWMAVFCAKTCNYCELLDPVVRCDRDRLNMTGETTVEPGFLDAMFGRLAKEAVVLSSPPDGPWVLQFDDFITDAQIEALVSTTKGDFERSTDSGSVDKHGVQEKVVSLTRTSSNAWCRAQCESHPHVVSLTESIERATGVPQDNFEAYQVLNYEVGQYYKTHHDMAPMNRKKIYPSGPRVLTFFVLVGRRGGRRDQLSGARPRRQAKARPRHPVAVCLQRQAHDARSAHQAPGKARNKRVQSGR